MALAGYRAMRRARSASTATHGSMCCGRPRDPPRRTGRGPGRPGPRAARLPVPRRPLMPSGRPYGPNDPSLISSLETAVRQVRRPGPVGLAWNWRLELGSSPSSPGSPLPSPAAFGLSASLSSRGPGWRSAQRCCAGRQPASGRRPGLVPHHPAPGQGGLRERLGADQERQAAVHLVHHAHGLRRAGAALAARAGLTAADLRPPGMCSRPPAGRRRCASSADASRAHLVTLDSNTNPSPRTTCGRLLKPGHLPADDGGRRRLMRRRGA